MITNEQKELLIKKYFDLLIEKYFRNHLGISHYTSDMILSGKEHFRKVLEFCLNKDPDFPNLDLVASNNPDNARDRIYNEDFLFRLCDESLAFINHPPKVAIAYFHEPNAQVFYANNIQRYITGEPLDHLHEERNNLSIVEKYKQNNLQSNEWLTDVDLIQLADSCGINNATVTNCNFSRPSEAILNLGMALHFKREDYAKNPSNNGKLILPLILETGSSLTPSKGFFSLFRSSQGIHWVSAIMDIDFKNRQININYMNSSSDWNTSQVEYVLRAAANFNQAERNEKGDYVHFGAFPGFNVSVNIDNYCLKQTNGWACGYYSFKNAVDHLPDNGNANFRMIRAFNPDGSRHSRHYFADDLRKNCYDLLLKDVPAPAPESKHSKISFHDILGKVKSKPYQPIVSEPKIEPVEDPYSIIEQMCLLRLDDYFNDKSSDSKSQCFDLRVNIRRIPSSLPLDERFNQLIDCLKLEINNLNKSSKRIFHRVKHHSLMYPQPINPDSNDDLSVVLQGLLTQVLNARKDISSNENTAQANTNTSQYILRTNNTNTSQYILRKK